MEHKELIELDLRELMWYTISLVEIGRKVISHSKVLIASGDISLRCCSCRNVLLRCPIEAIGCYAL
jgi:hypothetical protein